MKTTKAIAAIEKDQRTDARSATARRLSRWMIGCLVILSLVAIWQDRRLAPPVHDGLQVASAVVMDYIENSEALSGAIETAQRSYAELRKDG